MIYMITRFENELIRVGAVAGARHEPEQLKRALCQDAEARASERVTSEGLPHRVVNSAALLWPYTPGQGGDLKGMVQVHLIVQEESLSERRLEFEYRLCAFEPLGSLATILDVVSVGKNPRATHG